MRLSYVYSPRQQSLAASYLLVGLLLVVFHVARIILWGQKRVYRRLVRPHQKCKAPKAVA